MKKIPLIYSRGSYFLHRVLFALDKKRPHCRVSLMAILPARKKKENMCCQESKQNVKTARMSDINLLPLAVVRELENAGISKDNLIFHQNGRWVYQRELTFSNDNLLPSSPIDSLGPFGKYLHRFECVE